MTLMDDEMTTQDAAVSQLVDAIKAGAFDAQIGKLKEAVDERSRTVLRANTLGDFPVGQRIRIAENCGTQYLRGKTGTVVDRKVKKAVITLDAPAGRFAMPDGSSKRITCPVEILHKI